MAKQKLSEEIRQTYIIMYEKDGVKYIFNRSVRWNAIMNTKNIEKLIDVLGKDAISHFIVRMNKNINDTTLEVGNLTETFVYDDTIFRILEIHPEWENYNHEDQELINKRKKELCEIYDAVDRKDQISGEIGIELEIAKIIKKNFKKWLEDIYSAISEYSHLIYDETVKTTLWMTKESLIEEINKLNEERNRLNKQIENHVRENRRILNKQNFVIDIFNKYINNLDQDEVQKFKEELIKKELFKKEFI